MAEQQTAEQKTAAAAAKAAEQAATEAEARRVPIDRLRAESETRFGHPAHVLDGGLAKAGLSHRVNLDPEEVEAAIADYLAHEEEK